MQAQLEQRISELTSEFETGQTRLRELEGQAQNLRETLLRISGAIQVLKEELEKSHAPGDPGEAEAGKNLEQVV